MSLDNIMIERIWQDSDFFEIKISGNTKNISATTKVYLTSPSLSLLSEGFATYSPIDNKEFYWEASQSTKLGKTISFKVFPKDKLGHIFIEIYMLLEKSDFKEKYSCFFCVETELGLLNDFGKRLLAINKEVVGIRVSLLN